ncbi:MAG TPA: DsrE family protein [Ignavibacteriaceae bacterium]|nr:DsrE family protein [Ignavibacteriaceae bacterium]
MQLLVLFQTKILPKDTNIERMLKAVINKGGEVKACGTCSEARGVKNLPLVEGAEISNMIELTKWTAEADKVLTF